MTHPVGLCGLGPERPDGLVVLSDALHHTRHALFDLLVDGLDAVDTRMDIGTDTDINI